MPCVIFTLVKTMLSLAWTLPFGTLSVLGDNVPLSGIGSLYG